MMTEIRFWNEADENISVNGLYIHRVDEALTEVYIQAIGREAIDNGAVSVTIDTEYQMKDLFIEEDEHGKIHIETNFVDTYEDETIEDDYSSNMHCDTYGVCGGMGCPNYFKCHA